MTRRLQDVALVALAVLTAVLILLAVRGVGPVPATPTNNIAGGTVDGSATTGDTPDDGAETATGSPDLPDATASAEDGLASARAALASTEPVVVSVLGDSTSNARQEWVHRWAQELSDERPVTISHWDEAGQAGFVEPDVLSESGDGSPLTIWSGSQSGADATYALDVLSVIIPESPDLVVLNFGHNQTVDSAASDFAQLLTSLRDAYGDVPVVVVLQQPQVDDANAEVREAISAWAASEGLGTIDVAQAFLETDDITALLQDELHPNDDGSRLWARTVGAALAG